MKYKFIPYSRLQVSDKKLIKNSSIFYQQMNERRSVRYFTEQAVPKEVIENLIKTASAAPSGAHKQPWTFVAISDPKLKNEIRQAAERKEYEFYYGRTPLKWLDDLAPIGTDWRKPFLEIAPWLIVVFKKSHNNEGKGKTRNYYVQESVGIACGFLIAAIHQAGLATLTHTPSPMNFLSDILRRPANEKPFLLLPVGYPASEATVPDLKRKSLEEVSVFYNI